MNTIWRMATKCKRHNGPVDIGIECTKTNIPHADLQHFAFHCIHSQATLWSTWTTATENFWRSSGSRSITTYTSFSSRRLPDRGTLCHRTSHRRHLWLFLGNVWRHISSIILSQKCPVTPAQWLRHFIHRKWYFNLLLLTYYYKWGCITTNQRNIKRNRNLSSIS